MKENKLDFVFILLIIFWDSLYLNTGEMISEVIKYFILLLLILFCIIRKKKLTNKKCIYVYLPILILLLSCVFNDSYSMGYIVKAMILWGTYHIVEIINWESFKRIYTNIMTVICGYSLFFYILSNLFWDRMVPFYESFPEINRSNTVFFYNMGLTNLAKDLYSRSRNYGIFQEPGAYVIFILVALMFLLFNQSKRNYFLLKFVVLSATLISTLSTTGILCFALLILAYFFCEHKLNINKLTLLIMVFCGTFILLFQPYIIERIFEKLIPHAGYIDHSFSGRIYAIIINLKIWLQNVLFGVGPKHYIEEFYGMKNILPASVWVSQTNTILGVFSVFGAILGGQFVYLLFRFSNKIYYKKWVGFLLFIIWILLLFSQDYEYSLFLHVLTFYGVKREEKRCKVEATNNMCASI